MRKMVNKTSTKTSGKKHKELKAQIIAAIVAPTIADAGSFYTIEQMRKDVAAAETVAIEILKRVYGV